jgi:hypothetical protein
MATADAAATANDFRDIKCTSLEGQAESAAVLGLNTKAAGALRPWP